MEPVEYIYSWIHVNLNKRLGSKGAEMIEYAIVLACIAILAAWFYTTSNPSNNPNDASKQRTMVNILTKTWSGIRTKIFGVL